LLLGSYYVGSVRAAEAIGRGDAKTAAMPVSKAAENKKTRSFLDVPSVIRLGKLSFRSVVGSLNMVIA
jgi:hypothetical protein